MTLTVTERCNLRCTYCYVPVARGRTMRPEVLDAALDLFFDRHADEGPLSLAFFGGEPLLAKDLVWRAMARAERVEATGQVVRVSTPTNGLALDAATLAKLGALGVEVAVSVDGDATSPSRAFASGAPSSSALWERLPAIVRAIGPRLIARMTVTPSNVGDLARGVRALAAVGAARIWYQPAYELDWDDEAIAAWAHEHRRIAAWLVEERARGAKVPELAQWRAIARRLAGERKGACSAGVTSVAVTTEGALAPCYRLVDEARAVIGDVERGPRADAMAAWAGLDPSDLRGEDGACATCPARDGCTHACPALGFVMTSDVRGVPAAVCRLVRAQVEVVRAHRAHLALRPFARPAGPQTRSAAAGAWPAVAAALVLASSACGGTVAVPAPNADAAASRDATTDAADAESPNPFLHDDAGRAEDGGSPDVIGGGGLCPPPPPGLC